MQRRGKIISLLTISLTALFVTVAAADGPAVDAVALGDLQLKLNGNQEHRAYLGVPSEATLNLSQIRADHLIIVIFNSFCTICQADAPIVNSIYEMVAEDPLLKGKVKMIGIGTGNTEVEVEQFQQSHKIPYPLFADPEFKLDKAIPENLRAPMFVAVKNTGATPLEVVQTHMGALKNVRDLLKEALARALPDPSLPPGSRTHAAN
ncbi:MAG: redoxin domain-containing protein [Thermodesulfobacteriota bacterium]